MVAQYAQNDEISVLASEANWAWPVALRRIFQPCGVNLLMAETAHDFMDVLRQKRVSATIVDMESRMGGFSTLRLIRAEHPLMPCILLGRRMRESMLSEALRFDVFSVIDKPVDMTLLREQLDRLFVKRYGSRIFSSSKREEK
jgi:DNA-binding NtrC family response regulator